MQVTLCMATAGSICGCDCSTQSSLNTMNLLVEQALLASFGKHHHSSKRWMVSTTSLALHSRSSMMSGHKKLV
eukprot:5333501-Amphidinium_carterae.1